MNKLLILIAIVTTLCDSSLIPPSALESDKESKPKRCVAERAFKMNGYNCAKLELKEVPKYLKSNVEILDLSFNRIRDLDETSFQSYTDIKFLYLFENMIQNIAPGTFLPLRKLEAIDLSVNALQTIPPELFTMPYLRNLYIQHNYLAYLHFDLEKIPKPVTAPLQKLSLANCRLREVPDFGVLPNLQEFNISGNALSEIKLTDFSPYCKLKTVDLNQTEMSVCTCKAVSEHLQLRGINVIHSKNCNLPDNDSSYCPKENRTAELPSYYACMELKTETERKEQSSITWLTISMSLIGFFILFIGFLYCLHLRNTATIKRQFKKQQHIKVISVRSKPDQQEPEEKPEKEPKNHEKLLEGDKS